MIVACFDRNTMVENGGYGLVNFVPFRFRRIRLTASYFF